MRAGRLDRRIDIQRKTTAPSESGSGEPVETWADLVSRCPASVLPVKGDERFSGPQLVAHQQVEFKVRWSSDITSLNPKDRIIYPALDENEDPESAVKRHVYDILAVHRLGRREGFRIITQRRPELFEIEDDQPSTAGQPIGLSLMFTKAA